MHQAIKFRAGVFLVALKCCKWACLCSLPGLSLQLVNSCCKFYLFSPPEILYFLIAIWCTLNRSQTLINFTSFIRRNKKQSLWTFICYHVGLVRIRVCKRKGNKLLMDLFTCCKKMVLILSCWALYIFFFSFLCVNCIDFCFLLKCYIWAFQFVNFFLVGLLMFFSLC